MPGPVDRLNRAAKLVLALAQDEAFRRFHRGFIAPEHLLLALIREHESVTGQVLRSFCVDIVSARQTLEAISGRGDPQQEFAEIVLSPGTRKIIELASEEAKQLGAETVAPEHVLLAVVRKPGSAEPILQSLGVSLAEIRQKVLETRGR